MLLDPIAKSFRSWLKFICVLILTLLMVIILPLVTVIVLPIYLFRFLLIKYAKYYRPDFGKSLTARSSTFATDDLYGKPKANLMSVLGLKGSKTIEDFRRDFLNETVMARNSGGHFVNPEFQQSISSFCGFPFWKWDNSFQIENHIKEYNGTLPIEVLTKEVIGELCTEYIKTPFIPGRSPWEITVFPKSNLNAGDPNMNINESGTNMCAIFRIHHSLADGFSTTKALLPRQEASHAKPKPVIRSSLYKFLFNLTFLFRAPFEFVSVMTESFDVNGCHQGNLSENLLLAFSERIPISYVKDIKDNHGVSFTAVLLAAFTGAVRSFALQNRVKLPEAVHAVIPCPMQSSEHTEKLRNVMSACFVRLPVGLPTAEMRVKEIEKHLKFLKISTQPITMFYLIPLIGALPSCLARILFRQTCPTVIISNFPGPESQVHMFGRPIEDFMFTAGLLPGNIGIGFNAVTYNGHMIIQAAFNETIAKSKFPRNYLLEKVLAELQTLARKHIV